MDKDKDAKKKDKSAAQVLLSGIADKVSAAVKLGLSGGSRRKLVDEVEAREGKRRESKVGRF